MAQQDDDRPRKATGHEIGQDLTLLSEEELAERVILLKAEVERLETSINLKRSTRDAANRFFK